MEKRRTHRVIAVALAEAVDRLYAGGERVNPGDTVVLEHADGETTYRVLDIEDGTLTAVAVDPLENLARVTVTDQPVAPPEKKLWRQMFEATFAALSMDPATLPAVAASLNRAATADRDELAESFRVMTAVATAAMTMAESSGAGLGDRLGAWLDAVEETSDTIEKILAMTRPTAGGPA